MHSGAKLSSALLVGPPNSGKTTLFNWMTNSRYRAVNYPGSSVDCLKGVSHARYGAPVLVVDTPGVYGFEADSPEEEITLKLLRHDEQMGHFDVVVVCVDYTQLERHLSLALKIRQLNWPMVIALTMPDLASAAGVNVPLKKIEELVQVPVVLVNGRTGAGVAELVTTLRSLQRSKDIPVPLTQQQMASLVKSWSAAEPASRLRKDKATTPQERTLRLDQWLLHPLLGGVFFIFLMVGVFTAVFWLADPLMGVVDDSFSALGGWIHTLFGAGLFADFLADGMVASFGSVLVFVPQIYILFFLMGVLEDSGYLARAAAIVDRPLDWLGLSGRSFVPLLSGYACAVPAVMAARTIRSSRERWIATAIIPLLSCSARLPVYALLLGFVFFERPAWMAGLALAVIYLGSFVVSAVAAGVLNRLVAKSGSSRFILELPLYRKPHWSVVIHGAFNRTLSYVRRAGPVIFTLALILWFATNFPRVEGEVSTFEQVKQSYAGQVGQIIEPIFQPMGLDWRVGVGLISAFAAREVFVSALALVFDVTTGGPDASIEGALLEKMQTATLSSGEPLFTLASVAGLVVFFMIALQCTSTTAIVGKETGSWKFALMQLVALNAFAYMLSVSVVQGLSLLGI